MNKAGNWFIKAHPLLNFKMCGLQELWQSVEQQLRNSVDVAESIRVGGVVRVGIEFGIQFAVELESRVQERVLHVRGQRIAAALQQRPQSGLRVLQFSIHVFQTQHRYYCIFISITKISNN